MIATIIRKDKNGKEIRTQIEVSDDIIINPDVTKEVIK
jgi:hypothetical protein